MDRNVLRRAGFLASVAACSFAITPVFAQVAGAQAPAPPPNTPPTMQPPELLERAEAAYPEQARAARLEATVLLRLTIDAEGHVTHAEPLTEPLGSGFDEAALEAALRMRFKPAQRDGQPITARIVFPYAFQLSPQPPAAPVLGSLRGGVTSGGATLAGCEVTLTGPEGAQAPEGTPVQRSACDAAGGFRFEALAPGRYDARVVHDGREASASVEIAAGTEATLALEVPAPVVTAAAAAQGPVDVTVRGSRSEAQRLQESADAVNVVDMRRAKTQTADLGEVLARTQGVAVRRHGGLGSSARFALNGLYDDQIRFFLDGVPLDVTGYPFGITNIPVNVVDRVEVYRGVVPIRLGADALGGAVNLVSDTRQETRASASYLFGSYGTHRATLDARYRHQPSGFVVGLTGFADTTENNYDVDVEIPDEVARLHPATVPRFHDDYRAYGLVLESGVVDRSWARRLLVRAYLTGYEKELQHNVVMKVPYGAVRYGEQVYGATARYDATLLPGLELELVGSYAHRTIDFVDKSRWVYDWNGHRINDRQVRGEVEARPHDITVWEKRGFGRALLQWELVPAHVLRASFTPQFATRTGDERLQANPEARDPLTAKRDLFTFVSGVEYELSLFDDLFSNVAFVKDYYYAADSEESLPGNIFRERDMERHSLGWGDSLRYRFTPFLYAKASYEYATRLPRPDEVFGNGVLIMANLELEPEVSHNANIGPRLELPRTDLGEFVVDINAFLRDSERLIVLLGNDRYFTYQNVYHARSLGLENAFNWVSPGRYLSLEGMLTWQDVRNVSDQGTFGDFDGDRIPNRPYLFGSWGARLRFAGLPGESDTVEPFYVGRYVHGFFRGWESQGLRQFKQTVDAQVTHSVGVTWSLTREYVRTTATFEVDNITDEKAFDNYGVQRPGRSYYVKVTGDL